MTINVYIVDDSATARTALRLLLEGSDDINVLGVASNPLIALKRMNKQWPDVIISDLEMPAMDGIEFLRYLQRNRPTPFIVFSNHTGSSALSSVEALSLGAVEIIAKPDFYADDTRAIKKDIINAVKAAANVSTIPLPKKALEPVAARKIPSSSLSVAKEEPQAQMAQPLPEALVQQAKKRFDLFALGSSTGGTTLIERLLRALDVNSPAVLIVQHMPEYFTEAFAKRINRFCKIEVKEACDGDVLKKGVALIAPGGKHMRLRHGAHGFFVSVEDGDYVNRHKPSVDVLFDSIAEDYAEYSLGVILTGMGKDGAKGLLHMKQKGALTVAQSERGCAVYGMPKAAMAIEAADYQLSVEQIQQLLSQVF